MKQKIESFKIEFLKGLKDSDYEFLYDYDRIETCIEIVCIRDLLSKKAKFKIIKLIGTERLFIQVDKRFLITYMILQNGNRFELYEIMLSKYNEFERETDKRGLWE